MRIDDQYVAGTGIVSTLYRGVDLCREHGAGTWMCLNVTAAPSRHSDVSDANWRQKVRRSANLRKFRVPGC